MNSDPWKLGMNLAMWHLIFILPLKMMSLWWLLGTDLAALVLCLPGSYVALFFAPAQSVLTQFSLVVYSQCKLTIPANGFDFFLWLNNSIPTTEDYIYWAATWMKYWVCKTVMATRNLISFRWKMSNEYYIGHLNNSRIGKDFPSFSSCVSEMVNWR